MYTWIKYPIIIRLKIQKITAFSHVDAFILKSIVLDTKHLLSQDVL